MSFSKNGLKELGNAAALFVTHYNASIRARIADRVAARLRAHLETAEAEQASAAEALEVAKNEYDEYVLRISTESTETGISQESVSKSVETLAMNMVSLGMATLAEDEEPSLEESANVGGAAPVRRKRRTKAEKAADDAAQRNAEQAPPTAPEATEETTEAVEILPPASTAQPPVSEEPVKEAEVVEETETVATPAPVVEDAPVVASASEDAPVVTPTIVSEGESPEDYLPSDEIPFDIVPPSEGSAGTTSKEDVRSEAEDDAVVEEPVTEAEDLTKSPEEAHVAPVTSVRRPPMPRRPLAVRPVISPNT